MYIKFSSGNLNSDSYPQHPTNIYICRVTFTSRVCNGKEVNTLIPVFWNSLHYGVLQVNWIVNVGPCTFLFGRGTTPIEKLVREKSNMKQNIY